MATPALLDVYLTYSFLKRLALPFESWSAFKTGVIDKDGVVLVPKDKRTREQQESFGHFDVMVRNMKRLIGIVPGGKSQIASAAAALALMREYHQPSHDPEMTFWAAVTVLAEESYYLTEEDGGVPTNVVGGGAIAGTDQRHLPMQAQWGWPKGRKKRKQEAFLVDPKMFRRVHEARQRGMRYEEALSGALGWAIMEYVHRNPQGAVAIENEVSGAVLYLRHGKGVVLTCEREARDALIIDNLASRLDYRLQLIESVIVSESEKDTETLITEIEGTGSTGQLWAGIASGAVKAGSMAWNWIKGRTASARAEERRKRREQIKAKHPERRIRSIRNLEGKAGSLSGKDISNAPRVKITKVPTKPTSVPEVPAKKPRKPRKTVTPETTPAAKPKRPRKPTIETTPPPVSPPPVKKVIKPVAPSIADRKKRERKKKREEDIQFGKAAIGAAIDLAKENRRKRKTARREKVANVVSKIKRIRKKPVGAVA